jgi:hypothetical protein
MRPLTERQSAEAIEQLGDDLAKLDRTFTDLCARMPSHVTDRVNDIPWQDRLEEIAESFRKLGDELCREDDQRAEDEDRRRDNPLEPDYRRLGQ